MSRKEHEPPKLQVGFQKKRKKGPPAPRYSYAKRRAGWFRSRTTWPHNEAPGAELVAERAKARGLPKPAKGALQWVLVGPTNVGGRLTCLVVHPQEPDVIWVGAACGGVWKSENAGVTWDRAWDDHEATLNIGSLAVDPQNPKVLYCGTGEANLSPDSYPGVGLYRSRDSGQSWELIASCAEVGVPTRIGDVAVDPFDSRHICLGGVGHKPDDAEPSSYGGLWQSRDAGRTWRRDDWFSPFNYWCHCVVFSPTRPGLVFASLTERGVRDGIWRSRDYGKTWEHLTHGLPPADHMDRTMIAVAPSEPDVVYAQVASAEDRVLGVFVSEDGGDSWRKISGHHFQREEQMTYANAIVVHPTHPGRVLCGGVELHLTTNRGEKWKKVTDSFADLDSVHYAHADHHRLVIPPAEPNRVYDASDGGLSLSEDGGLTWKRRSAGLAITMFYDADVSQTDPNVFGGGTQDNGTWITLSGNRGDFQRIDEGDGGWMVIDPTDEKHIYSSVYNVWITRHITRRSRAYKRDISPGIVRNKDDFWMVYIDMDPKKPTTAIVGTDRVLRTRDDGLHWDFISEVLDGSAITAIDISRTDSQRIYIGTENGGVFRTTNGGKTWSGNLASAVIPGFQITRIESHPVEPEVAYVTTGNFGKRHVFRTNDGGDSWACIDGNLPGVPFHAVVVPDWDPESVYVASDAGVFVSRDGGKRWLDLKLNLPNVQCVDLVAQRDERTLMVATYGRSLWRLKV